MKGPDSVLARIFVDPWPGDYGSAMQIDDEAEGNGTARIIDAEGFTFVEPSTAEPMAIAFVDGVRQRESGLAQWRDGRTIPGMTGAYAVGAVIADGTAAPTYTNERVERVLIWSSGTVGGLPPHPAGWNWTEERTAGTNPKALMLRLQELMRRAEANLADFLAAQGLLVLLDGTLWFASEYNKLNIAGYVKTHHVRLLPLEQASRLPDLPPRWRTTVFRTDANRYAIYLRLAESRRYDPPMAGIVRLEFSGQLPLDEVRRMADRFSVALPAFAGVAHIDPRAPQNLQPIGALETHLRHLMGDAGLAERAVRDVVALAFPRET